MDTFKSRLITNVESTINNINRKVGELEEELENLYTEQQEARETLQFLKTGEVKPNGKKERKQITNRRQQKPEAEWLAALKKFDGTFTSRQLAEMVGSSEAAAQNWTARWREEGKVTLIREVVRDPTGQHSSPALYRSKPVRV